MLTAYDYSFASILDEAGLDMILVGDSLGNVILGCENTLPVTMADMLHHTRAAARGVKRALLVADMPYKAAVAPRKALSNAKALIKAGAQAVKIEGIKDIKAIAAIVKAGIPVMGHIGCLPQTAKEYKIQRSSGLLEQAKLLASAGVFAVVLELVEPELAKQITDTIKVPTIGIGSGPHCDGQVLVSYDMLGLYPNAPRHAKKYVDLKPIITEAVRKFMLE